jgi:hypothetical protein
VAPPLVAGASATAGAAPMALYVEVVSAPPGTPRQHPYRGMMRVCFIELEPGLLEKLNKVVVVSSREPYATWGEEATSLMLLT